MIALLQTITRLLAFISKEFIEVTSSGTSNPVREADLNELQQRLNEAMMRLSNDHRAVVTMFDIQGMPHAEIAKILGISQCTLRNWVQRKKISRVKVGGRVMFRPDTLRRFIVHNTYPGSD